MKRWLILAIAAWSGFYVMAIELLSGRLLAPDFGSSIYVWGGIITVFMLGLSIGYLAGGRLSMREPSVRRLGLLLLAAALTTLPVVFFGDAVLAWLFERVEDPRYGSLLASALLFLVPTVLSGTISPYAVRLLVTQLDATGREAGALYFVSTFGSAAGTIVTSFYLVLWFELDSILLGLIAISSVLALCAWPVRASLTACIVGVCALGATASVHAAERVLHTERSLYRNILVYEDGGVRCMKFGRRDHGRQTCQRLDDPQRFVFQYTRMMMASLYFGPSPRSVLVVGLGGGTLPMALQRVLPGVPMDAVEIDPAVVEVAKRYFGFRPAATTRVHVGDGRVFVKRALARGARYDLVMLDAFDQEYIPEHLLTREFLQEVKTLLTPRGVLAANTFSTSRLYDYESATYASVFGPFQALHGANRVILVRLGGAPTAAEIRANAAVLAPRLAPLGAEADELLRLLRPERAWPASTRVLTDQYSPSNLLQGAAGASGARERD